MQQTNTKEIQDYTVSLTILWWLYRVHQIQLVSLSLSCSTVFSVFFQYLPCGQPEWQLGIVQKAKIQPHN